MNERQTTPGAARHLTAKNADNRKGVFCLAPRVLRLLSEESAAKKPPIGKAESFYSLPQGWINARRNTSRRLACSQERRSRPYKRAKHSGPDPVAAVRVSPNGPNSWRRRYGSRRCLGQRLAQKSPLAKAVRVRRRTTRPGRCRLLPLLA